MVDVNVTDEFVTWWDALSVTQQEDVDARVRLLEEFGPSLGRPVVDRVKDSAFQNMKELRCSSDGALRVLFALDPRRQVVLLFGGNKSGAWTEWYSEAIPAADDLYREYLGELRDKGVIK